MKVFVATYDSFYYDERDMRESVVVANTLEEAKGLLLTRHSDTTISRWSIKEVDTSIPFCDSIANLT